MSKRAEYLERYRRSPWLNKHREKLLTIRNSIALLTIVGIVIYAIYKMV